MPCAICGNIDDIEMGALRRPSTILTILEKHLIRPYLNFNINRFFN